VSRGSHGGDSRTWELYFAHKYSHKKEGMKFSLICEQGIIIKNAFARTNVEGS